MKKSKLMMISSFALAMVASLVMAFAMMNVTKADPATVNAANTNYYVYLGNRAKNTDTSNEGVKYKDTNYTLGESMSGAKFGLWAYGGGVSGVLCMGSNDGHDWFVFSVPEKCDTAILLRLNGENDYVDGSTSFPSGEWNRKEGLSLNSTKPYYLFGSWVSISSEQLTMFNENAWYLIGKLGGSDADWTASTSTYKESVKIGSNANKAEWYNVYLKAGDKVKAVHSDEAPAMSDMKSTSRGTNQATNGVFSTDEDGNAVITNDGYYNVYLYDSDLENDSAPWYISIEIVMLETRFRLSENNDYILFVTLTNVRELTYLGANAIGYNINGVAHDSVYYYTAINLKTEDGYTEFSIDDIMNTTNLYVNDPEESDKYGLIVYELPNDVSGNTYSVQAFAKNGGTEKAHNTSKTKTVAAKVTP